MKPRFNGWALKFPSKMGWRSDPTKGILDRRSDLDSITAPLVSIPIVEIRIERDTHHDVEVMLLNPISLNGLIEDCYGYGGFNHRN